MKWQLQTTILPISMPISMPWAGIKDFFETFSQNVRPEVPHHPWRDITEQGLQDGGPLSMMDN